MLSLVVSGSLSAGSREIARLSASLQPGPLEVSLSSVELKYLVTEGAAQSVDQFDSIKFLLEGLVVNDLNGDGKGWRLTANPEDLRSKSHILPVGTEIGFRNFESTEGIQATTPYSLLSTRTDGIASFECDFAVSYDIPAFSPPGQYEGRVYFSITSE